MISLETKQKIKKMYQNDVSISVICKRLKVSRNTVLRYKSDSQKSVKKVSKKCQKSEDKITTKLASIKRIGEKSDTFLTHQKKDKIKIDMSVMPDEASIRQSIMIAFRETLDELISRLPVMKDKEIYDAAIKLLQELNAKS